MIIKKFAVGILAFSLLFSCLPGYASDVREDWLGIYVQNGAENGDGSIDKPFGTFEEARDKIRSIKAENQYPKNGITVYFREGKYALSQSALLTEEDSGTAEAPVVYRAYANEQVVFTGGYETDLAEFTPVEDESVKSRFSSDARDKILQLNLKDHGITEYGELTLGKYLHDCFNVVTDESGKLYYVPPEYKTDPLVTFNGQIMDIARYPNKDEELLTVNEIVQQGEIFNWWRDTNQSQAGDAFVPASERPERIKNFLYHRWTTDDASTERIKSWQDKSQIFVQGNFVHDWADERCRVEIDKDGVIEATVPMFYGVNTGRKFYMFNILEELDSPGEYYLDRETGIVYIYPPEQSGTFSIGLLEDGVFVLDGAENIKIAGIRITGNKGNGITLTNCKNVTVELSEIDMVGGAGIAGSNIYDCRVVSCSIHDLGIEGVVLNGGERDGLIPGNNVVENCEIHSTGMTKKTYAPAIKLMTVGNKALYNKVHDTPHVAMNWNGNDQLFEYNEVYNVVTENDDMAAFYAYLAKDGRGNIIRNNYVHDMQCKNPAEEVYCHAAVYLDGSRDGTEVSQNVFENIGDRGININTGRDNTITDNIFINIGFHGKGLGIALSVPDKDNQVPNQSQVDVWMANGNNLWQTEAYSKYPHLQELLDDNPFMPKYNNIQRNVTIDVTDPFYYSNPTKRTEQDLLHQMNSVDEPFVMTMDQVGFVNAERRNYTLREDSPIFTSLEGFKAPDFQNMGMYTDWLEYKLRDTVSMLIGSPIAYTGFNDGMVDEQNPNVVPMLIDDKTYLPIRFIAEALGNTVEWDEAAGVSTISNGTDTITVSAGNNEIIVNGKKLEDADVKIFEDRTYLPLRVVGEALNKEVTWFENGIVIISEDECQIAEEDTNLVQELYRRLSNK